MSAIVGVSILGLIGCQPTATNSNRATVLNTNTNTAAMNSNANVMNSNMNSNASSNTNKTLSSSDQSFLETAGQGGIAEVQMGGLAITNGDNPEVKAFGQKMVSDHSRANRELREIANQRRVSFPGGPNEKQMADLSKLQKLSGAAFDKEYVKLMVADHEKDVAEFQKQADNGTDTELKNFAADTLPKLKMHLEMIKTISKTVK